MSESEYLPWYTAAGLGSVGSHYGSKAPGKLKLPATVAGTLAGTGAGVHAGEGLAKKLEGKKKQAAVKEMREALSSAVKKLRKPKGPVRIESMGMRGQVGLVPGGGLPGFPKVGSAHMFAGFSDELHKLGAGYPEPPERPAKKPTHPLMIGAQSAAGIGIGMAAGYGIAKAMENIARKKGFPMDKILPIAVAGAGTLGAIANPLLHSYERKKMEDYASQRT